MLFLGLIVTVSPVAVAEETTTPSAAIASDIDIADGYVWRGQVLSHEAVLQPALTVTYGGFSVNVWSNMNLNRRGGSSIEFNEIDFTASYGFQAGPASLSAGLVEYSFPNVDVPGTTELFFSAGLEGVALQPSISLFWDVGEVDGLYATASLARTFGLTPRMDLIAALSSSWSSADYNAAYFGVDRDALNDTAASLSASYALAPEIVVELGLSYMWLADGDVAAGADTIYGRSDRLSLVAGFSHAF